MIKLLKIGDGKEILTAGREEKEALYTGMQTRKSPISHNKQGEPEDKGLSLK